MALSFGHDRHELKYEKRVKAAPQRGATSDGQCRIAPPGRTSGLCRDGTGMQAFFNKLGIAGELLAFLWAQKLWWMIPLVVMLLLLAALIAFASATSLGPFIYPLI
ncbi:MAG: DUF5989 family protein [Chloroflexota bacterium]